ncbi:MAG: pyridoxal phosphate-dependent aminotransferase [Clostridiaceae bacterium]
MDYSLKAMKLPPSITLAITAKAKEMKAEGKDVVGFGAGEPDFNTPMNIIDACKKALDEGKTKYVPASGINELKDAVINKFKRDNDLSYERSQIIISTGGKQCLFNTLMALTNPGDEILIAKPYWVSYPDLIALAGGNCVVVDTREEEDYKFTMENLESSVTVNTKAIIVNSPNNPTGTVYSKEELQSIADFCKKHDIFIISDEIYEPLIYGEEKHISIASLNEDAYNRTVVINALSKAYAMTGWRLGYAAGPKDLIKIMGNIQSHTTSNSTSFVQYAAVEALNGDQSFIPQMNEEFRLRRDYMVERADKIKGLDYIYPKGAFYLMLDVRYFIGKHFRGNIIKSSLDLADMLLSEYLVAVVPGSGFGLEGFLRLSYAINRESIKKGFDRIEEFLAEIS